MTLEVLDGGLAGTIQDGGRPEWTHLGVPPGGAADPWSFAIANLLIGNDQAAAVLEMTVVGATLLARRSMVIGLAGADLGGRVVGGRRLLPGRTHRIDAGETIAFPGEVIERGARAYLAFPGGIDVPEVLGSRSTCLAAGFGGLDGRTLRAGDVLRAVRDEAVVHDESTADASGRMERIWPAETPLEVATGPTILRVLPGPGRPIVLGPDHQTTGGYPVVGVVASADRPLLGQMRPGADVRLRPVDHDDAVAALQAQRAALSAGVAALREALAWDELARSAGA